MYAYIGLFVVILIIFLLVFASFGGRGFDFGRFGRRGRDDRCHSGFLTGCTGSRFYSPLNSNNRLCQACANNPVTCASGQYLITLCSRESRVNRTRPHQPHAAGPVSNTVNSSNWSGYATYNNNCTYAVGTCTVPSGVCSKTATYSSYWVGLDGYNSSTVEQLGFDVDCSSGRPVYYAWFEMYPQGSFLISGFPIAPGQSITMSVSFLGNGVYTLMIRNNTLNFQYTVPANYTTNTSALHNSAEWIVEAPTVGSSLASLTQFTPPAQWTNCSATVGCNAGPINRSGNTFTAIQMVSGSTVKAVPSALNAAGNGFSVTWKHA